MSTALTRLQDEHKQRLQASKLTMVDGMLKHAKDILAYYEECKKTREWGENTFANRIGEWLDYSASTVMQWLAVAKNEHKFRVIDTKLPTSLRTLYELSSLPQADIEECLEHKGPDLTREEAVAFKRALKAPPPKPTRTKAEIDADIAKQQATASAPHQ